MAKKEKVYTVSKRKNKDGWKATEADLGVIAKGENKTDLVQATAAIANLQTKAVLRIEREDGHVQEERAYPRRPGSGSEN